MNWFQKLFCQEEEVADLAAIDLPPPVAPGTACNGCGGMFKSEKLRPCYTVNVTMGDKFSSPGVRAIGQTDWSHIRSILIDRLLYCQRCFPKSEVQMVLRDSNGEGDTKHFSISEYQYFQEIDVDSDESYPELYSVGMEQYNRGSCSDCDGPNAPHDKCPSCRRKNKEAQV